MTPVLVFDIETIPDASGLRVAWDLADHTGDGAVRACGFFGQDWSVDPAQSAFRGAAAE